jgi:hypothetical protein
MSCFQVFRGCKNGAIVDSKTCEQFSLEPIFVKLCNRNHLWGQFELAFPATWGLGGRMGDESESVPEGKVSDQMAFFEPRP